MDERSRKPLRQRVRTLRKSSPLPPPSLRHRLVGVIVGVVVLPVIWVWVAGTFEFIGVAWLRSQVQHAMDGAVEVLESGGSLDAVAVEDGVWLRVFGADGSVVADLDRVSRKGWLSPFSDPFYGPEGRPELYRIDARLSPVLSRPEVAAARTRPTATCEIVERGLLLVCVGAEVTPDGRVVHVTKGSARLMRSLYEQRFQLTAMTLVMVVVGTVLALLLGWRMVGPLEQLRNQVVARTAGIVSTEPVVMDRDDEIGELAVAFNQLLGALDDRNRANTAFAADLAHELKNPVAAVLAATEALSADRPVEGERLERLRRVLGDASRRMEIVVHQFLEIARAEAGLPGSEREDFDLFEMVTHLVESARGDERNRGVRIEVVGCAARVRGVPERLETAVRNLLSNACFYAGSDGTVRVAVEVCDGEVEVTVEDDGPGIAEADLAQLFTRYHTSRAGGTGLGLSMAQAIVVAHGGRIAADGGGGPGATFRIRLPVGHG